mmetsp:Transcript_22122/g.69216  ORF Transcript_22122/g.69216 Transcript_22122/m.69216 type:complete len:94 (+) Transcript_22122:808-1089(+)
MAPIAGHVEWCDTILASCSVHTSLDKESGHIKISFLAREEKWSASCFVDRFQVHTTIRQQFGNVEPAMLAADEKWRVSYFTVSRMLFKSFRSR